MAWQTSAGASLAIGDAAPTTFDATGYAAVNYTEIGEITNIGDFGGEFALVTHQPLATRGVKKGKGSYNNGTLSPQMALDNADEGQQALEAARMSDDSFPFRVTLQSGGRYYMMGKVMSVRITIGDVDSTVTAAPTIEVDSEPVVFAAS